jgi:predicted component of type VI protein secretion system
VPKERRVFVVAKFREFDEAAWKRLLVAYAYALHNRRQAEKSHKEKQAQAETARQEGTA